ncbi:cation diffusion facilitator family transporter [Reticulomyxa filosa]|uniref:Cation diffusion facilitator family transporter n=1 Tax=Reticulomyxa filosa TaxID=46433 RepID=X6MYW6_RETFI|nr:cation diffusion facilitator family transporter [Reticulomyxa filosa]|eukprot:ETO18996.1 cation diffusion facilitator family transporter [Reticulomyxa filosa]
MKIRIEHDNTVHGNASDGMESDHKNAEISAHPIEGHNLMNDKCYNNDNVNNHDHGHDHDHDKDNDPNKSNAYTYFGTSTGGGSSGSSFFPLSVLSRYDRIMSTRIHMLECGTLDYVFIPGAFIFGSKFMFVTILFSIVLVKISGFLFTGICCAITVSITQFGKSFTQRLRPDPVYVQKNCLIFAPN